VFLGTAIGLDWRVLRIKVRIGLRQDSWPVCLLLFYLSQYEMTTALFAQFSEAARDI
jgi:hypothetical protein